MSQTQGMRNILDYWIFKVSNRQRQSKLAIEIQEDKYVHWDEAVLFGFWRTHKDGY